MPGRPELHRAGQNGLCAAPHLRLDAVGGAGLRAGLHEGRLPGDGGPARRGHGPGGVRHRELPLPRALLLPLHDRGHGGPVAGLRHGADHLERPVQGGAVDRLQGAPVGGQAESQGCARLDRVQPCETQGRWDAAHLEADKLPGRARPEDGDMEDHERGGHNVPDGDELHGRRHRELHGSHLHPQPGRDHMHGADATGSCVAPVEGRAAGAPLDRRGGGAGAHGGRGPVGTT
mmetsp:Transcript_62393/g.163778  ORF Transcript_62393/g.163778 Transcript_62393/m.163778 type:complete len:232 (+) Transcript_62393:363-1058(+)